jgi:hypothetical protein
MYETRMMKNAFKKGYKKMIRVIEEKNLIKVYYIDE